MDLQQCLNPETINSYLIRRGLRIAMALVIFVVGRWTAKLVASAVRRMMKRARLDDMLTAFLGNIL